jgi:hypothetical protein
MVAASAGVSEATVTWVPPAWDGGAQVTNYTVAAMPGGATCTALAPNVSCTVTGLLNGTAYTFTAIATNDAGDSSASAPSTPVTPNFVYSSIGVPVLDPSGMTVTVNSITLTPRTGSTRLTISYTLANQTADKRLDEGAFRLYFTDGTDQGQNGIFRALFPGDSLTRTYTWEYLNDQKGLAVGYDPGDRPGSIFWRAP